MAESRDRLLSGRYRLIDPIGRGGMGTVWWAHDEVADREVAVKEMHLPPSLGDRERDNLLRRTNREALAAGRLRHPGLIAIYDVVIEDARPWLIMEYVPARSLEDVFAADGPISPLRVAEIGRQLLDALRAAHDAGIVHRDVKPSNVLLETSGRVVLTDFGIATYEGATTLTQTGTFMGSPAYVAPEVARGERATPASDLWSLGATLYAAVEGRPPYHHETAMATLSALATSEPDPPVRAGPLRPLLDGLLCKDTARRLTAERAAELLAALTAGPGEAARRKRTPVRLPRPPRGDVVPSPGRRVGLLPFVTGGVLAAAIAAGVVAGLAGQGSPDAARSAIPPGTPPASAGPATSAPLPRAAAELPAALPGRPGRPASRRVAARGGTWPQTSALTLTVPPRVRRTGARLRLGLVVACRAADGALSFTASAIGPRRGTLGGSCAAARRSAAALHVLDVPAGTSRLRIRVHRGTSPARGPIDWLAGLYQTVGR